jgi:putative flippase GtrA
LTQSPDALAARNGLARQIPAFVTVGAIGFCVDAGLTVLIASGFGVSPFLARPPAVLAATVATFLLNRAFTFRGKGDWRKEILRYCAVVASGQAVSYAVYAAALTAISALGLERTSTLIAFSVACGAGTAMFLTFAGFRFFAFKA